MNSYDFFIYEFICFMNSYMNSGVPRFQMIVVTLSQVATVTHACPTALRARAGGARAGGAVTPGGVCCAGARLLLLLPCWTKSAPSFAPPGGVRGAGAGLLLLLPCWTRSAPSFVSQDAVR